jgi:hypothetical protein
MTARVDVVINVYGKPYQTAVTLLSLLKHSGRHISKLYFIKEKKQPYKATFDSLLRELDGTVEVYRPPFFLWTYPMKYLRYALSLKSVRHSIRYQYAWEKSDNKYLFITHNDVFYNDDIIKYYLENIENNIAIGQVGMCWNCSAHYAQLCDGDKYLTFRPAPEEYAQIVLKCPHNRNIINRRFLHKNKPWPLPECRLNEWACMINLDMARQITMPTGKIVPFGTMMLDIGTEWFYEIHQLGYEVKNIPIGNYAKHGWAGSRSGHDALFDSNQYSEDEKKAFLLLDAYKKGYSRLALPCYGDND